MSGYVTRLQGSLRRNAENYRLFGGGALTRFFTRNIREYRWPMKLKKRIGMKSGNGGMKRSPLTKPQE